MMIPARFWADLTPDEFREICRTSCLQSEQVARLYRMLDIQAPPPARLELMVNRADLERLIRKMEKEK